jgi:hypothetical protein
MRWRKTEVGESRIISKFLFLPKCIEGEWRVLEVVQYEQIYKGGACSRKYWEDVKWLN